MFGSCCPPKKYAQSVMEHQWLRAGSLWSAQSSVLKAVSSAISLGKDEPGKEEVISSVRKQTNEWVAKYRRDSTFAGRPSYGCGPSRRCSIVKDSWIVSEMKCPRCLFRDGALWLKPASLSWAYVKRHHKASRVQDLPTPRNKDAPQKDRLAACVAPFNAQLGCCAGRPTQR